jgi:hypothetical protein
MFPNTAREDRAGMDGGNGLAGADVPVDLGGKFTSATHILMKMSSRVAFDEFEIFRPEISQGEQTSAD